MTKHKATVLVCLVLCSLMVRMRSRISWRQTDSRIRHNTLLPPQQRKVTIHTQMSSRPNVGDYNPGWIQLVYYLIETDAKKTLTRLAVAVFPSMAHTQKILTQTRTTVTKNQAVKSIEASLRTASLPVSDSLSTEKVLL